MMNFHRVGFENNIAARGKSPYSPSFPPPQPEGQAVSFLKDVLTTINIINTDSGEERKETPYLKEPATKTREKKSLPASDKPEAQGPDLPPQSPAHNPLVKSVQGDKGDEGDGQDSEKKTPPAGELPKSKDLASQKPSDQKGPQNTASESDSGVNAGDPDKKGESATPGPIQSLTAGLIVEVAGSVEGADGEINLTAQVSGNDPLSAETPIKGNGPVSTETQPQGKVLQTGLPDRLPLEPVANSDQIVFSSSQIAPSSSLEKTIVDSGDSGGGKVENQIPVGQETENRPGLNLLQNSEEISKAGKGLPIDQGQKVSQTPSQPPIEEISYKTGEPKAGKIKVSSPFEAVSDKGKGKAAEGQSEIGKSQTADYSPSSPLAGKEALEGKGIEKGMEGSKESERTSSGGSLSDPESPFLTTVTEDLKTVLPPAGLQNKDGIQNWDTLAPKGGDNPGSKGSEQAPTPETIGAVGNPMALDKTVALKGQPLEQVQRSSEIVLPQEQTFTIKKHSPTSMEVVLEPEGLGKLDIELKMTAHHIQAQITVDNLLGRDLLEKNLSQLLTALSKEGVQIGDFSISLRNQGRDQNPTPFNQPESRGQPLAAAEFGGRRSVSDNHLVHIII
jgi:flagellar hook-length control protein FliK